MNTDERAARPSWQTRVVTALVAAMGDRELFGSPARVHAALAKRDRTAREVRPPAALGKHAAVTRAEFRDWPVFRVTPPGPVRDAVFFLHGGGFIREIVGAHWKFAARLGRELNAEAIVPIYPLIPHAGAAEMVEVTAALLARTLAERGPGRTFVIGNSAGAGLALAATQALAAANGPRPAELILISPWLDASMSHPDLPALETVDPFHRTPGFAEIGRVYADGLDVRDPRVSPLFGPMAGLPPLTVFSGTREIFLTDARGLAERAEAAGVAVDYHEAPGQPHNYALFPTPEGRAAREVVLAACRARRPAGQPR